ncbi:MAG: electron transfer flavoprotein [Cyanobacteria bacterium P01_H01_bin.74]
MSDSIAYDILLVGGSPSNLALAHRLTDLAKQNNRGFTMAILEKGKDFGANIMSGAVTNPHILKQLFPDYAEKNFPIEAECTESFFNILGNQHKWTVPSALLPSGLKKEGYWVITLSHVVSWMVTRLQEKLSDSPDIVIDFFPGFSAHQIVYNGNTVVGVQVVENPSGEPNEDNIYAGVTCFGDKGFLSRDLIDRFQLRKNPQLWSVGVKEVWELPEGKSFEGKVWHTLGYPLVDGSFGGGFVYGMKNKKLIVGLVISLDSPNPNINPQQQLQDFKKHPWLQSMLADGKLLKYGAALLPEGGYFSLPEEFSVDGAMLLGDALGVLDIAQLAGVDSSMACGLHAAEVLYEALQSQDFSAKALSSYKAKVMESFVGERLYKARYFRKGWQENPRLLGNYLPRILDEVDNESPFMGFLAVGLTHNPVTAVKDALRLKTMLSPTIDLGPITYKPDHQHINPYFKPKRQIEPGNFDQRTIFSRPDAVFYADPQYHEGNAHIDEFNAEICIKCIAKYDALQKDTPCVSDCTAEVHRVDALAGLRQHGMSLENCIQCRTCEIVCPEENLRVNATAEGSGPDFMGL